MDIVYSKKFQAAMIRLVVAVAKHFIPQLDETSTLELLAPILAYILGQGLADSLPGKEKIKMEGVIREIEREAIEESE